MARSRNNLRRRLLVTAGICLAWGAAFAALRFAGPYGETELHLRENLIRWGKKAAADPRLVYLGIDEASIALEIDPAAVESSEPLSIMRRGFPFSRDLYAHLFDRLVGAGAEVVALDLILSGPREGDDALRDALERHGEKIVIGAHFAEDVTRSFIPPSESLISSGQPEEDPRVGVVNFWPDIEDEVVRRARYRIAGRDYFGAGAGELGEKRFTSFAGRILERLGAGDKLPSAPALMRLAPVNTSFPRFSLYQIFVPQDWEGRFAGGAYFQGKTVVVGPYGDRFKDQLLTPLGSVNGAEMHLNAVNAALRNEFFTELGLVAELLLTALAVGPAFLLAIPSGHPHLRFGALLLSAAGYVGGALLLANAGLLVPLLSPVLALLAAGATAQAYQQLLDQLERARTRRTLERYVSRNVVKELLDEPSSYLDTLGGVRKPVAVMFSDLRGFTSMTESGDSHRLVAQLNEYFSEMVKIVFEHGGTLDKFIGDAIMAVWGNIKSDGPEEDVCRCVAAVLAMREALVRLNAGWEARGMPRFSIGFGINHGEAIVGNLGSTEKMELTVIGDAVNLASRLEGATKQYGIDHLLGEEAGRLASARFHVIEVDRVRVKGRAQPAEVLAVLGPKDRPLPPAEEAFLAAHREGLARYRARDFAEAERLFARSAGLLPGWGLAEVYAGRCRALAQAPPAEGWDGVFVMTSK